MPELDELHAELRMILRNLEVINLELARLQSRRRRFTVIDGDGGQSTERNTARHIS